MVFDCVVEYAPVNLQFKRDKFREVTPCDETFVERQMQGQWLLSHLSRGNSSSLATKETDTLRFTPKMVDFGHS